MARIKVTKEWYRSKKLWMAVITLAVILLSEVLGVQMNMESILGMAGVAMTYIFAQGKIDADVRSAALISGNAVSEE